MFKAVLFDAAETLFHTRGTVGEIYGEVARKYGSTVPRDRIQAVFLKQFRHSGPLSPSNEKDWWKDVVRRVFSEVGMIRDFDRFFDEVYDKFRDSEGWTLYPETTELLVELKSLRLKLAVISNFDSRIYSVMRSLGILHFFDAVTISSEAGFAKPDPRIFEVAVRSVGSTPAETLLVGDSLRDDVEAGKRVGLTAVLVDRDGRYPDLEGICRIASLREILPLLHQDARTSTPSPRKFPQG
jgi:putative hydrolase of the HAD superfamily